MSLDLSSRLFSIEIYRPNETDPIDVSFMVESISVSNSQLGETGLITTTGTITLYAVTQFGFQESFLESLDPRTNNRWAIGNRIDYKVANSEGDLVLHPRGRLYVLEVPVKPFADSPRLEISVGCRLSLKDSNTPSEDSTNLSTGTASTRTSIINSLLTKAELPALYNPTTALNRWSIDTKAVKDSATSYVSQAGEIAYSVGCYLWSDNQGRIRCNDISLNPNEINFELDVSQVNDYSAISNPEKAASLTKATGLKRKSKRTQDPEDQVIITRTPEFSPCDITNISTNGLGTEVVESTKRVRRVAGLVVPENGETNSTLIPASYELTRSQYEERRRGYLKEIRQTNWLPRNQVLPRLFTGDATLMIAERIVTTYTYDKETTSKIETISYQPREVVYGTAYLEDSSSSNDSPTTLVTASIRLETWKRVNKGYQYTESTTSFVPGSGTNSTVSVSSSGSTQPPAAEQKEPAFYEEEAPSSKEKKLRFNGDEKRVREYEVPYVSDDAQLDFVADLLAKILYGRTYGISFSTAINAEFLEHYHPLMVCDFEDIDFITGNTTNRRYLLDGDSFAQTSDSLSIACDGIYLGDIRNP